MGGSITGWQCGRIVEYCMLRRIFASYTPYAVRCMLRCMDCFGADWSTRRTYGSASPSTHRSCVHAALPAAGTRHAPNRCASAWLCVHAPASHACLALPAAGHIGCCAEASGTDCDGRVVTASAHNRRCNETEWHEAALRVGLGLLQTATPSRGDAVMPMQGMLMLLFGGDWISRGKRTDLFFISMLCHHAITLSMLLGAYIAGLPPETPPARPPAHSRPLRPSTRSISCLSVRPLPPHCSLGPSLGLSRSSVASTASSAHRYSSS